METTVDMSTCEIQWIVPEKGDIPTPDSNPAVGFVVSFANPERAYPICADHLKRMPREGWRFLDLREFADPAKREAALAEIKVVTDAIKNAFKDAGAILPTLRYAGDHYSFTRWGMYVGVEPDGYIHT